MRDELQRLIRIEWRETGAEPAAVVQFNRPLSLGLPAGCYPLSWAEKKTLRVLVGDAAFDIGRVSTNLLAWQISVPHRD